MAARSFESVYRDLKRGDIAPVYYFSGSADALKDDLISAIVTAVLDPSARDFNLDIRSAGDLDSAAFHTLVETPPLLAPYRVVVVTNLEQWRKNAAIWKLLHRYLEAPAPTTVLILTRGTDDGAPDALADRAYHVDLTALEPEQIRRWAEAHAQRLGLTLSPEATGHLLRVVGGDLTLLATELAKLAAAVGTDEPVSVSTVVDLIGVRQGETVIDWLDAVLARDLPNALRLTDVVLAQTGVSAVRLVATVGTAFLGLCLAGSLAGRGMNGPRLKAALFDQIRRLRPPGLGDWREEAGRWADAASRWPSTDLARAIRAAYDADRALKSTTVSTDSGILRTMLLQMAAHEAAA